MLRYLASALLAASMMMAYAAQAQEPQVDASITYHPAELSSAAGQQGIAARVRAAAWRACADGGVVEDPIEHQNCTRQLSQQMMAKVPGAGLAMRKGANMAAIASR